MMPVFTIDEGPGPLIGAAIHNGHEVRPEVEEWLAMDPEERLREEDPLTSIWTSVVPSHIRVHRSRFEVDMNRPREEAVYREPHDAWGLHVWRAPPPAELFAESLREYDAFYAAVGALLRRKVDECGRVVMLDIHTYNHRRAGPHAPPAPAAENPEVNLGTATMDRAYWAPLVDRFIDELRHHDVYHHDLDVRENVKFKGGHFPRWVHENFYHQVCVLSVEFKKAFMDEWTGTADISLVEDIQSALRATVEALEEEIAKITRCEPLGVTAAGAPSPPHAGAPDPSGGASAPP